MYATLRKQYILESTHKGVNQRSKDVTQTQQRPVTLTWQASKYEAHKLHQRYILEYYYVPCIYSHARRELP